MATSRGKAVRAKDTDLRNTFWPDAEDRFWDRTTFDGYTTVPKTMPLLMRAMNELSKGKPLGQTYFALWCATWDNGFVRLGRAGDLAYASGLTGPRGLRGWQERMKLLEKLGFVEIRASGDQKFGLAFLPNPNVVLLRLWEQKKTGSGADGSDLSGLQEPTMTQFLERALDVSANDVTAEQKRIIKAKTAAAAPAPARKKPTTTKAVTPTATKTERKTPKTKTL